MRQLIKAAFKAAPAPLRNVLLRQSLAIAEEDAKFKTGYPTMWGSLQNLARWFSPGGVVDVGANVGSWAVNASRIFHCPVHMIEAQASLEPSLQATGLPYTITLLGRETRLATSFFLSGTGSSAMREVTGLSEAEVSLPMRRLDDVDLRLPKPLLMKLDVQGYELEVLAGAPETLARTEVILSEVSLLEYNEGQPLIADVIAYLGQRDFVPFDICGGLRRSSDLALFQTDMIFVRRDSSLRDKRKFWSREK